MARKILFYECKPGQKKNFLLLFKKTCSFLLCLSRLSRASSSTVPVTLCISERARTPVPHSWTSFSTLQATGTSMRPTRWRWSLEPLRERWRYSPQHDSLELTHPGHIAVTCEAWMHQRGLYDSPEVERKLKNHPSVLSLQSEGPGTMTP